MVKDCYTDADIVDFIAYKYQDLYTSVPFNANDMDEIRSDLSVSIQNASGECILSCNDVLKAVDILKLHKIDRRKVLSSDYLKKAGHGNYVHFAVLLSGIIVHGYAPDDLCVSTIIPISKGKNQNVAHSDNYGVITLSSIFRKICDLIVLDL